MEDRRTTERFAERATAVIVISGMIDMEEEVTDTEVFAYRFEEPVLAQATQFSVKGAGLGGETEVFGY